MAVAWYAPSSEDEPVAGDRPRAGQTFDEVADALYALDPDAFVAARDESAKELRAAGDKDAAKAVKALRRPTVAAWAVNQLARTHREQLDELLDVTDAVANAQRAALSGKGDDLRSVGERRQRILDDLVTRAEAVIDESGRSSVSRRDDIVRTLQASSDAAQAELLRQGRLATALEADSALEGLAAWFESSGEMTAASKRAHRRNRDQAARAAEQALEAAEGELRSAAAEVDRVQAQLREAKRRVDRARKQRQTRADELEKARRSDDE
jgi:hypothetical protein